MAVPTRTEALALLMSVAPSARLLQHVTVVAEVASFLAHRAARAGLSVDRRLVETAALLHDIDKALPQDHPVRALGHGRAGAAWLREAGHAELARPVASHPVMQLDEPGAPEWVASAPLEDRIVCYADKRATQRVVSLEQRFGRWQRKHPEYGDQLAGALRLAQRLESEICGAIGIRPDEVERLPWVADALARAGATSQASAKAPADPDGGASETTADQPVAGPTRAA